MILHRHTIALFLSASLALSASAAALPDAIDAELTRLFPPSLPGAAVLVVKDGVTLLDKGYGLANVELNVPVQPDQLFSVASVGKQFTAAGILTLAEAGKLSVSDPIRKYFPGIPPAWDGITIEHLLHHTSGIGNIFSDPAFRAQVYAPHTPAQILAQAERMPLLTPVGTAFLYSSTNYTLLAMIIEQVSGEQYDAYLGRRFFVPLGMTHTHFNRESILLKNAVTPYEPGPRLAERWNTTLSFGGGSYSSNNADLLRWTMALQGGKVLQPATLAAMNTALVLPNGQRIPYGDGVRPHTLAGQPYLQSNGDTRGYHAEIVYLPASKVHVAMLTNGEDALRYGPGPVVKRIVTMAAGMPRHAAVAQVLPDAVLQQRAGVYRHGADQFTVHVKEGQLQLASSASARPTTLLAISATEFYDAANTDFRIHFITGKDGQPALQRADIDPLDGDVHPVFDKRAGQGAGVADTPASSSAAT